MIPQKNNNTSTFRQAQILRLLRSKGKVTVDELVSMFGVTPQTIRKDLSELEATEQASRVHGGAIIDSGVRNLGYQARLHIGLEEKRAIGVATAKLLPDGASVMINIGTTTEQVARALRGHEKLLVISNNLNVVNQLVGQSNIETIMVGGLLRPEDGGIVGESAVNFIEQFKVDYAVIGCSAIDEDGAVLDYDYREVQVARAIIKNARRTILVAHSAKFQRTAPMRIINVAEVWAFVTDRQPPQSVVEICHQRAVNLVTTHSEVECVA